MPLSPKGRHGASVEEARRGRGGGLKRLFERVRAAAFAWKESLDHLAIAAK